MPFGIVIVGGTAVVGLGVTGEWAEVAVVRQDDGTAGKQFDLAVDTADGFHSFYI